MKSYFIPKVIQKSAVRPARKLLRLCRFVNHFGYSDKELLYLTYKASSSYERLSPPKITWAKELNGLLSCLAQAEIKRYPFIDPQKPIPFEKFLAPIVEKAGNNTPPSTIPLQRDLLKNLSSITYEALFLEFKLEKQPRFSLEFFKEYPVLARLIVTTVNFWKTNLKMFLKRLEKETFANSPIKKIESRNSDPHDGGKRVLIATFGNGFKIVYKPRNLEIEKAFFSLLKFFNEKGSFSFKIPQIILRKNYGFMEYIHTPPKDIARLYQEVGSLICLAYILSGTDFHVDNILPCGSKAVLVDLETLFIPKLGQKSAFQPRQSPGVARSHPRALSRRPKYRFLTQFRYTPAFKNVLSTSLLPVNVEKDISGIARFKEFNPLNYLNEIEKGFEKAYRFVLRHKKEVDKKIVSLFEGKRARFLLRNTSLYLSLLKKSCEVPFLEDGSERSLLFKPLLKEEFVSLYQMDVPRFTSITAGLMSVKLSREDLKKELLYIRTSLLARYQKNYPLAPQIKTSETAELAKDRAIKRAISIGEDIEKWASGDTLFQFNRKRRSLETMKNSLYNGLSGVSLFLAALSMVTGSHKFKKLSLLLLNPLRKDMFDAGTGGFLGIGSYIYVLSRVAHLLDEKELFLEAKRLIPLISPNSAFDVVGGSAGAILALLSTNAGEAIPKARLLGNHLIQMGKKELLGFSHGAAGIAYSLFKLYQATKEEKFWDASLEWFKYENSHFSPKRQNWPDFRSSPPKYPSQWCHGAIGIGFARIGLPRLKNDLKIAVSSALTQDMQKKNDTLCCGNFGVIDFLLTASLEKEALKRANLLVKKSSFSFVANRNINLPILGFMKGSSGIGYELLRLFYPKDLPSVLLLE